MKSETPRTDKMRRETSGQSWENQFRETSGLCEQLEKDLTALCRELGDENPVMAMAKLIEMKRLQAPTAVGSGDWLGHWLFSTKYESIT